MKFNVRVRIIDPHHRAIHEDRVYEADTGLEAMQKAQADEANTKRGLVQCNGCDPLPAEPIMETKGEKLPPPAPGELSASEPMAARRGRPPKHQVVDSD